MLKSPEIFTFLFGSALSSASKAFRKLDSLPLNGMYIIPMVKLSDVYFPYFVWVNKDFMIYVQWLN